MRNSFEQSDHIKQIPLYLLLTWIKKNLLNFNSMKKLLIERLFK